MNSTDNNNNNDNDNNNNAIEVIVAVTLLVLFKYELMSQEDDKCNDDTDNLIIEINECISDDDDDRCRASTVAYSIEDRPSHMPIKVGLLDGDSGKEVHETI